MQRHGWGLAAFVVAAFVVAGLSAPKVFAFETYTQSKGTNTWCASCHGGFDASEYSSQTDGQNWGNLHNLHQTMVAGECVTCHGGAGGGKYPVVLNVSAGGPGLDAIACVGCHGRAEDDVATNPDYGSKGGYGAGLRQHHYVMGTTVCAGCHQDANPANYTPVGEDVLPPYYADPDWTGTAMPTNACNPSPQYVEDFAGITEGLDNDGDGTYDELDLDCSVSCTDADLDTYSPDGGPCGPIDCDDADPDTYPGATELCDGFDNDCDGTVPADEIDDDGDGMSECEGDCDDTAADVYDGATELCDGVDNDCDGPVDEDYPSLGTACVVGAGACERSGSYVCTSAGDGTECSATPGTPGTETCDGTDEDCDGLVDEDLTAPLCALQDGVCAGSTQTCEGSAGWASCDRPDYGADYELDETTCDGLDNDCDGLVDEGDPGGGASCDTGELGVCSAGTYHCTGGALVCEPNTSASPETCDGADNDCDGSVDEDYPSLGTACVVGTGACERSGSYVCTGAGDGTECDATPGTPGTETCDGTDEDCDGSVDEDLTAPLCAEQDGVCAGSTQTCGGSSGWLSCGGSEYGASYEMDESTCDGLDNDCDTVVDEGCGCTPGQTSSCGTDVGECVSGSRTCQSDGTWGSCTGEVGPTAERCDGLDNDCDGDADETFTSLGTACTVGTGACQATGSYVCNSAGDGVTCDATPGSGSTEVCNGIDDDCDGTVDDGDPDGGGACDTGLEGVCAAGTEHCVSGSLQCQQDTSSSGEVCDGADNDCDGAVDEDYSSLGASCTVGTGACESTGSYVCTTAGDGVECDATPGTGTAEMCNGVDDDCDGETDEDFTTLGDACTVGTGACEASGTNVCSSAEDGVECDATVGTGTAEMCNGVDDDCDGETDEDFTALGDGCSVSTGACEASGTFVCSAGGALECDATPGTAEAETCNDIDDDCDGEVDEGVCGSDAGVDAGPGDAGPIDGGAMDAGRIDAGPSLDAGPMVDGAIGDAAADAEADAAHDAGGDAARTDAPMGDAGEPTSKDGGCSCRTSSGGAGGALPALLLLLGLALRRRRG